MNQQEIFEFIFCHEYSIHWYFCLVFLLNVYIYICAVFCVFVIDTLHIQYTYIFPPICLFHTNIYIYFCLISVMTMEPAWKHIVILILCTSWAKIKLSSELNTVKITSKGKRRHCTTSFSNQTKFHYQANNLINLNSYNIQMASKSPGTSQRCRLILQHCLAIQLSKPGHTPEDFWMYDSGYMIFQVSHIINLIKKQFSHSNRNSNDIQCCQLSIVTIFTLKNNFFFG